MSLNHLFADRPLPPQYFSVRSDIDLCLPAECPSLLFSSSLALGEGESLAQKSQSKF